MYLELRRSRISDACGLRMCKSETPFGKLKSKTELTPVLNNVNDPTSLMFMIRGLVYKLTQVVETSP